VCYNHFRRDFKFYKNYMSMPKSNKQKKYGTVALIVLDGWGYREDPKHNAIAAARTPVFSRLWSEYPHTLLEASGLAVGLPHGQMGNSEIGHTTIGAGKIIDTDLVRIAKAIDSDEFASNPALMRLFQHVKTHNSTLHVKGLIGNGGVHAHSDHLHAFLRAAKQAGVTKLAIHAYTDGRDTAPQSAAAFLQELEQVMTDTGIGFIASVTGRFYAMDRDNNWDRVKRAEDAIFSAEAGLKISKNSDGTSKKPSDVLAELYKTGVKDELLEPIVFLDENGKGWSVGKNDGIFFFNFRTDRARQISRRVAERVSALNLCFVTMTEYDKKLSVDTGAEILVAFPASTIETTLAAEISRAGLTQAHIAETEKFPHATYFLNGGQEKPYEGERHIMLDSRKDIPTHDLAPKMRAEAIATKAIEEIERGTDFIFINFANPDMVGHTANAAAIVEAIEEVDIQLGRVIEALEKSKKLGKAGKFEKSRSTDISKPLNILNTKTSTNTSTNTTILPNVAFITADHGNAETNVDLSTGEKHTAHTINPVPAIITSHTLHFAQRPLPKEFINVKDAVSASKSQLAVTGTLADIAPTILALMELPKPPSMSGSSML
jgi:2,3-bisphosphoglycerate-independent phosphoglycerate mutase